MIRPANGDDAAELNRMAQRFVDSTPYRDVFKVSPVRMAETIGSLLNNPDGVLLVSEKAGALTGLIGMVSMDHAFSGERVAMELVWWVEPEARGDGVRLLKAAEKWAREHGVQKMQMVAPDRRVGALYKRLGYAPVETSYWRTL